MRADAARGEPLTVKPADAVAIGITHREIVVTVELGMSDISYTCAEELPRVSPTFMAKDV